MQLNAMVFDKYKTCIFEFFADKDVYEFTAYKIYLFTGFC